MATGAGDPEGIARLIEGGAPYGLSFLVISLIVRYAPGFLRSMRKDWSGEQDAREKEITTRERDTNTWRDLEIARLRAEIKIEHDQREKNADLARAWYMRTCELTIRLGEKIDDLPGIEDIKRVGQF